MTVRGPLKFKSTHGEFVFARNAVTSATLTPVSEALVTMRPEFAGTWYVSVNNIGVFRGTEKGARRQFERALRYVQ